jgi:hypothetical protein
MGQKLTLAIASGLLCFALSACGGDNGTQGGSGVTQPPADAPQPPSRMPSTGQSEPDIAPGEGQ